MRSLQVLIYRSTDQGGGRIKWYLRGMAHLEGRGIWAGHIEGRGLSVSFEGQGPGRASQR